MGRYIEGYGEVDDPEDDDYWDENGFANEEDYIKYKY